MKKRLGISVAVIALVGLEGFQAWQLHKTRKDLEDVKWSIDVSERDGDSVITPDVGTIQFLKKGGYSIELSKVNYTGDGLYLQGFAGNPTNLWITNLTLKFVVQKNLYEDRDEWEKDQPFFFLRNPVHRRSTIFPYSNTQPRN